MHDQRFRKLPCAATGMMAGEDHARPGSLPALREAVRQQRLQPRRGPTFASAMKGTPYTCVYQIVEPTAIADEVKAAAREVKMDCRGRRRPTVSAAAREVFGVAIATTEPASGSVAAPSRTRYSVRRSQLILRLGQSLLDPGANSPLSRPCPRSS